MCQAGNTRKVKFSSTSKPTADTTGLMDVVHAVELVGGEAVVRRLQDVINTSRFWTKYSIVILKLGYFIHRYVDSIF